MTGAGRLRAPLAGVRAERLMTPLVFLLITAAVVFMPAERSGWDLSGVVSFLTFFATTVAIFSIFALGLNIQWGYTGVFNFGIAGFFLVGSFTAAIFTKGQPPPPDPVTGRLYVEYVGGFGDKLDLLPFLSSDEWLPFLVGTAAAALMCGILAFLISIPTLRLREDYLAIATIGVAELLRNVALEEEGLVNGPRGLLGIPSPFEGFFDPGDYRYVYFFVVVAVLILVYIAVERGIRSPWGRVLRALREDELATAASGKNVYAFKTQAFVFGAMIMGVGGSLYAYELRAISPEGFSHFFGTFIFWVMLIVGGSGNNRGAILGAYIVWGIWIISLQLQGYTPERPGPLGFAIPGFLQNRIFFLRDFLIGSLIVGVLLLRPQGLLPEERRVSIWVERQARRLRRARPEPAEEAEGSSRTEG